MKLAPCLRILRDSYFASTPRQSYWAAAVLAAELRRLFERDNAQFRRHVARDLWRYCFFSPRPIKGETEDRIVAAVRWLLRAHSATADDGVSLGWFPCSREGGTWKPSYPETTGYIITSLLNYASCFDDMTVRDVALGMARWEIGIQMSSGAVQGGPVCPPERQTPAAFNTGMVLDGWCSAYDVSRDPEFLQPARRAANFLVADLDANSYFKTNGSFVSAGEIKTYTSLCAWGLYRLGQIIGDATYRDAAIRSVDAALRQQKPNGWFAHNCLTRSDVPLTHTIGYTLQGVLEVGALAGREDYIAAARVATDRIVARMHGDGYLPGRFYDDWEPGSFSSCLTGAAQIAVVCYRLGEIAGEPRYVVAADHLVDYLKALQDVTTPLEDVKGALPGSFPIFGQYMRGGYPNWATKYLLDALLQQHRVHSQVNARPK